MKKTFKEIIFRNCLQKLDLKMKLTTLFLMVSLTVMYASEVYAQKKKLSINTSNLEMAKVIEMIEEETGYRFVYNLKSVDLDKKVNVNFKNMPIESVLDNLFKNTTTEYKITGKNIILKEKKVVATPKVTTVTEVVQEQIQITGKVIDEAGLPMT